MMNMTVKEIVEILKNGFLWSLTTPLGNKLLLWAIITVAICIATKLYLAHVEVERQMELEMKKRELSLKSLMYCHDIFDSHWN